MRPEKALFVASLVFCVTGWLWPHVKRMWYRRTYPQGDLWTQRMYDQADLTIKTGLVLAVLSFVALFLEW